MMKLYRYLYYRLYSWSLRKKRDLPQLNALLGVSLVMAWNLLFLVSAVSRLLLGQGLSAVDKTLGKTVTAISFLVLLGINYFVFMYKGKYKTMGEDYKDEPRRKKRINTLLLFLYFFVSLILPVLVWG